MPQMLNFGSAPSVSKKVLAIESFKGLDLTSSPTDINSQRSPDAPNMMPDSKGNPIKRTGFSLVKNYGERINGRYSIGGHEVIHAGTKLFIDGNTVWSGMRNGKSTGQIIGDRLYIFDGEEPLVCDGEDAWPLIDEAYIPTVLISKNADFCFKDEEFTGDGSKKVFELSGFPESATAKVGGTETGCTLENNTVTFSSAPASGAKIVVTAKYVQEPGGSSHEAFNLIGDRWSESFLCETGTETVFSLSKTGLSKRKVKAKVLNSDGDWIDKTEGTDFTVDRETGKVTFKEAVGKTPVTGEDNLIITAGKWFEGYYEKISLCRRSVTFDEGGISTRIFVTGNPEAPNRDFWCAVNNPTYFPDTYYSELGNSETEILGYSIFEGYLATHIFPAQDGRSIILRKGSTDESGNVSFPVAGFLQGEEAFAPRSFVYMQTEPLFLTRQGVYAITPADIDGRMYAQNRSYYINKELTAEEGLRDAECARWKQFYLLSLPGKLYLIDTSQKDYARAEPHSTHQYECYKWTGIDARILWEDEDGSLCFGDERGNVCRFEKNFSAAASYEDYSPEGNRAIDAYWTIPDFSGGTFWRNKTIRTVAIQAAPYASNKLTLFKKVNGLWERVTEWTTKLRFFDWREVQWSEWNWSCNTDYRTVTAKVKIKKFDKVGFRISCSEKGKAFGLYGFSVEYTESGRYKK